MTTSPFVCPLDCGWRRDQADPVPDPALAQLPVATADIASVWLAGHLQAAEAILHAHLETHELIERVQAVNLLRCERDLCSKEIGVSREDARKLHRMLGEQYEATQDAEEQVARIRAFLKDMATWCSPHGVAADYACRGLDALDGWIRSVWPRPRSTRVLIGPVVAWVPAAFAVAAPTASAQEESCLPSLFTTVSTTPSTG